MARQQDIRTLFERFQATRRLVLGPLMKRVPFVRQMAIGDCGAAALAMVLKFHGKDVPLADLRRSLGIGRNGSTALVLLDIARIHGLRGRCVRIDLSDLTDLPTGTILHWQFRHFVVFERATKASVHIVDPAVGRRSVGLDAFGRAFTGIALIFEPIETFERTRISSERLSALFSPVIERKDLLARILGTALLGQALSLALPLFTSVLVDRIVPQKDYTLLLILAVCFFVCQSLTIWAGFIRSHLLIYLRTHLEIHFTLRFLDHLVALPYAFFQQHSSGDLLGRLGSNSSLRETITSTFLSAVLDGGMAGLYLLLMLIANRSLTYLVLIVLIIRLLCMVFVRRQQRRVLAESVDNQALSQTSQVELLTGMEALKAMGLEFRAAEQWAELFVDGLNISIRRGRLDAMYSSILASLDMASTMALMVYGGFLVLNGVFSLGTMMAFTALAAGFLAPIRSLASSAMQFQIIGVYIERLQEVLNTPVEQSVSLAFANPVLSGDIKLTRVSFRYSENDPFVVDDISLQIVTGARVALIGRTGSGKSTIARLIGGLYEPTSGQILLDDQDFSSLNRFSMRRQLGFVTQDVQLFGGSIRRNIALSDPKMGLDRVIRAAKLACIHDEITAMPMGYETQLADRGRSLSGGQRQRLAIARALASDPKILILDEATSHLDSETEYKVSQNLASLRCTRIVVAHRLSTVWDADQIFVLEQGRLVEAGKHNDVIEKCGIYRLLFSAGGDPNQKKQAI